MCQVTSNSYGNASAMTLGPSDFTTGALRVASFARPGKLFTANVSLMVRGVGSLSPSSFGRVLDSVIALFRMSKSTP